MQFLTDLLPWLGFTDFHLKYGQSKENKNKKLVNQLLILGRGRRIRTLGTWFWRPLLYRLSYTPLWNFQNSTRAIIPCGNRFVNSFTMFSIGSSHCLWKRKSVNRKRVHRLSALFWAPNKIYRHIQSSGGPSGIRTRDRPVMSRLL